MKCSDDFSRFIGSVTSVVLVMFALLTPFLLVSAQNTPPQGCAATPSVPCSNPQTTNKSQAWPAGAHVTVNIDPSFDQPRRDAIQQSFLNWQGAGSSRVSFNFTFNVTPPSMTPPAGTYNAQVWNQAPPRNTGLAGDNAVTTNGTNAVSQEIWLNPLATDKCALAQTSSHETGHGFGLGECPAIVRGVCR